MKNKSFWCRPINGTGLVIYRENSQKLLGLDYLDVVRDDSRAYTVHTRIHTHTKRENSAVHTQKGREGADGLGKEEKSIRTTETRKRDRAGLRVLLLAASCLMCIVCTQFERR